MPEWLTHGFSGESLLPLPDAATRMVAALILGLLISAVYRADLPPSYVPAAMRVSGSSTFVRSHAGSSEARGAAPSAGDASFAANRAGGKYPSELCGRWWL